MAKNWPILVLLLLSGIESQSQKIFFEQLTTAEGLPSDYVNCVFEDSKGYLWVGTDKGACRYDGRQFQYFNNDNGLSSNFVSCFSEDGAGNIWIGTINKGIAKYDGQKIVPVVLTGNENANIKKIHFNQDKSFFVLAEEQTTKTGTAQISIILYFFKDELSMPQKFPDMAFLKVLKPDLFITGSIHQLFTVELKNQELFFHPLAHPKVENGVFLYWLNDSRTIALKNNSILEYTTNGAQWTVKKDFSIKEFPLLPDWTIIKNLFIDNDELFIATANGLIYVDNENKQHYFKAENGLGVNYVQSIHKDRRNNIYICTYGAGIKIWPVRYLEEYHTNGKVTSIFPAGITTYITTTKTVYGFNQPTQQLYESKILNAGNFTSIYKSPNGDFYLGTLNNFYKLPQEGLSKTVITSNHAKSYSANSGASGFIAHEENIYISSYGNGIYVFDGRGKNIDTLNESTNPTAPLIVEFLLPLRSSFAALTYNTGLTIYDSVKGYTTLTRTEGLLSNTVYSVFQEKENEIWIGTQNGLNLFNNNKVIETLTSGDGLVGSKVLCIFRDSTQRFWVLSDKFLHLLEGNRLRAVRSHRLIYDEKNAINRAAYNRATNTLFIGLTDALLTVNMSRIIPDTAVNIPKLLAVKRDSAVLAVADGRLLSLSPTSSNVIFQFDHKYSIGQGSDLYYKLSGFDEEWKLLANTPEITYSKLPAGDYELMAKTINPDGYESAEFSLLKWEVLPPLWKRGWFIALVIAIMLGVFFYTGNIISRKRYRRKLQYLQEEYRLQLERERIARELHDNVGSQLTYLINKIDDDHGLLANKTEAKKLSSFARGTMQELRETIWALNKKEISPEELENKIRQLTQLYKNEKQELELNWNINNGEKPSLKSLEALNIYRIIQEALNNAEKYSSATTIRIDANNFEDSFNILIKDNGKGFDINNVEKGFGLQNMYKRAEEMNADIKIDSGPGIGTSIKLTVLKNQPFS